MHAWADRHGWVWVIPPDEPERRYPTSLANGAIRRAHLVWNRAHPDDLVWPPARIYHRDGEPNNDRVENLEKRVNVAPYGRWHISDPRPWARGPREHLQRERCKYGHPLSGENLYVQPDGKRRCRTCARRRQRQLSPEAHKRRKAYWRDQRAQARGAEPE